MSTEDPNRLAFERACFAYYLDLKAKGWQHQDEGDCTPASLFWREAGGKYGVHQIEAAWCGWQMCMQQRPMADICPPATARDRWMYEQGRLAERDARTQFDRRPT